MHILFSLSNIPWNLSEYLLKRWPMYQKLKKKRRIFISVTKKKDCGRWQKCNLTPLFSIKFYWCAQQNLFTALIHLQTTVAVCPTWFFLILFMQAVMTNTTCFLSKFVMFLKYTPFSRTYCIKLILHQRFFSPDIINYYFDNFAGRVKWFLGLNPLVCFSADFFLFTEAIHFQFWITLFFNLHTSACLIELKPTLRNASSGSASHLETSHVSKLKGSIDRLFDIF